jgi:DNA-binding CsgD family transcriptional regulator
VAAPTLVLHRQGNEQMPLEASQRLAEALPAGRLIALPGSAPALFLEDEEGDLSVILDFLTDATAPAPRQAAGTEGLTRREAEVLVLIAQGESNAEIGMRLGISVHTVERHAANLYRKIGARGRSDATAFAVRRGMA